MCRKIEGVFRFSKKKIIRSYKLTPKIGIFQSKFVKIWGVEHSNLSPRIEFFFIRKLFEHIFREINRRKENIWHEKAFQSDSYSWKLDHFYFINISVFTFHIYFLMVSTSKTKKYNCFWTEFRHNICKFLLEIFKYGAIFAFIYIYIYIITSPHVDSYFKYASLGIE